MSADKSDRTKPVWRLALRNCWPIGYRLVIDQDILLGLWVPFVFVVLREYFDRLTKDVLTSPTLQDGPCGLPPDHPTGIVPAFDHTALDIAISFTPALRTHGLL